LRKAPFSVFSPETTVAVPYKRPPELPPPIVVPVKAEAIPTVYKSPPKELRLSLEPVRAVPRTDPVAYKGPPASLSPGWLVPERVAQADPVAYKEPPKSVPLSLAPEKVVQAAPVAVPSGTASGVLQERSSSVIGLSARSIEPGSSTIQSTPVAVPSGTASVTLPASSSSLPGVEKAHPPPPPPYPILPGVKLPDGVKLPPVGSKAVEEQLEKIGTWLVESNPDGQGIIRPQPPGAEQAFRELMPSFLAARGLTRDKLEFVGYHEGWLEYHLKEPAIKTPGAQIVADNWNDQTKWPANWVPAYHGGRWYGFWNTVVEGWINISRKGGVGMNAGGGDGHYCAVDMDYARWF
jgi:hypothetical protein